MFLFIMFARKLHLLFKKNEIPNGICNQVLKIFASALKLKFIRYQLHVYILIVLNKI